MVEMPGHAHYVRYDETTASRFWHWPTSWMLNTTASQQYNGGECDRQALEKRLAEFEGIGPETIEIFMRDAALRCIERS